ncbi:MAG: DUF1214 domain-containing protein [Hyphomicrobiales bacterium]|nr:DUF1214 domain-containing protein [Hyphomicrobiales bacterium]
MRYQLPLGLLGIVAAGFGIGMGSAWLMTQSIQPLDAITLGVWIASPNAGTPDADPYSRARLARTGELPLGSGEGLALVARTDSGGRALQSDCIYRVLGHTPQARLWTLSVEAADGRALASGGNITAVGSEGLFRQGDGGLNVVVAPTPQAGIWLASNGTERFDSPIRLVARLYDTPARTVTALTNFVMPEISRERCL